MQDTVSELHCTKAQPGTKLLRRALQAAYYLAMDEMNLAAVIYFLHHENLSL